MLDLRDLAQARAALAPSGGQPITEMYQLAAEMDGMGFISTAECEILRHSALINVNVPQAAVEASIRRYFFSSSVCVYRDMAVGEAPLDEDAAYPARPDNEYGWEKLFAERVLQAYGRRHGLVCRIARFQNCYGPEGTWTGGREKAPAAICRKVAEAPNGGEVEVWGDGTAVRFYIYVDDLVDGVVRLMHSGLDGPANIGTEEYVSVRELVEAVIGISGKRLTVRWVPGRRARPELQPRADPRPGLAREDLPARRPRAHLPVGRAAGPRAGGRGADGGGAMKVPTSAPMNM